MSIVEKAVDKHRRRSGPKPPPDEKKPADDAKVLTALPQQSDMTVDVTLNHKLLADEGINPQGKEATRVSEDFRLIKRPLLSAVFRDLESSGDEALRHPNLVMVTSAVSGEGKTFTSLNLAMSIALERDRTVVLVDADVAKPHVSRLLGLAERRGLLDLLRDETLDVSDVLLQTDMASLKVIPAGKRDDLATELLASQRMLSIAKELAERYPDRIILFDSPPLLQTAEAPVLAGVMGLALLVVHAGQTPQQAVSAAIELLSDTPAQVILNKSRISSSKSYYSGYYGS